MLILSDEDPQVILILKKKVKESEVAQSCLDSLGPHGL